MAKATINTKGMEGLLEDIQRAGLNVDAAADRALLAGAQVAQAGMKRRAPKDTHNLEEHVKIKGPITNGTKHSIDVGLIHDKSYTDEETARYGNAQEYGTSSMPAQPFIRPTMDEDRAKISKAMEASLKVEGVI